MLLPQGLGDAKDKILCKTVKYETGRLRRETKLASRTKRKPEVNKETSDNFVFINTRDQVLEFR